MPTFQSSIKGIKRILFFIITHGTQIFIIYKCSCNVMVNKITTTLLTGEIFHENNFQDLGLNLAITIRAITQIINDAASIEKPNQLQNIDKPIRLKDIFAILNKYADEDTCAECFVLRVLEICR